MAPGGSTAPPSASNLLLSMDDFAGFKQIGKGKDCVVYSAQCAKLGGASVVLKVYDKSKISAVKHRSVRREARIMRYLTDKRIPHTTAYTGAFQDSKQIYIVMEHCGGGDLLEQLLREGRAMAERRVVREVVLPTLSALAHLHAAGIIHRDIKLENLFISSSGHLQLGDFGLAISVLEERAISPVGTLEYMAPEILRLPSTDLVVKGVVRVEDIVPVDEKVDVWSFGVTVYELVTGRSPFEGASKDAIRAAILGYQMRPLPSFLSAGCQDFMLKAMCPKPCERPGAIALLNHPWVQMHCTPADLVSVARLPLQLPKTPMGYKQPPLAAAAPAAGAAQQQAQQAQPATQAGGAPAPAAAADGSGGGAPDVAPAAAPAAAAAVADAEAQPPSAEPAAAPAAEPAAPGKLEVGEAPQHSKQAPEHSTPSTPCSPHIGAYLPAGGAASAGASTSSSSTGVRAGGSSISSGSAPDGGRRRSSRSSNSSASAATPHGVPAGINASSSSDSSRALSTADSAASLYSQHALGGAGGHHKPAAAGCFDPLAGAGFKGGLLVPSSALWTAPHEPIQESPTDELAAAGAARSAGGGGALEQQAAAALAALGLPHGQQLGATRAASSSGGGAADRAAKARKTGHANGLFKYLCLAGGVASPNESAS